MRQNIFKIQMLAENGLKIRVGGAGFEISLALAAVWSNFFAENLPKSTSENPKVQQLSPIFNKSTFLFDMQKWEENIFLKNIYIILVFFQIQKDNRQLTLAMSMHTRLKMEKYCNK